MACLITQARPGHADFDHMVELLTWNPAHIFLNLRLFMVSFCSLDIGVALNTIPYIKFSAIIYKINHSALSHIYSGKGGGQSAPYPKGTCGVVISTIHAIKVVMLYFRKVVLIFRSSSSHCVPTRYFLCITTGEYVTSNVERARLLYLGIM